MEHDSHHETETRRGEDVVAIYTRIMVQFIILRISLHRP